VKHKIGDRVGAICGSKDGVVDFFGYGVYQGDSEIPFTAGGLLGEISREVKIGNPKILLDSGKVVWGCECWWASEESIKKQLEQAKEVKIVDIEDYRKEWVKT